jgi:DNA-directed RNA polymerase specialized sigma24 family protein
MLRSISPTQESTPEVSYDCHDNLKNLDDWLKQSRAGSAVSRNQMLVWVHRAALEYYLSKVHVEALFSKPDAWDLASESVVEFERSWHRVRTVAHYCRRMFKNNLSRFLKRKRKMMHREQELDVPGLESSVISVSGTQPVFEFESMSDEQLRRLQIARQELVLADDVIRCLFNYRVFSGCLTYAEIGEILGTTETSLRMRMTRFNRRVRNRCKEEHRRTNRIDRSPATGALSR